MGHPEPQLAARDEVHRHLVVDHLHAAGVAGGEQAALHLATGRVLDVGDAAARVAALAGEVKSVALVVKLHAQGLQPADPVGPLPDGDLDRLSLAESRPCYQGVLNMQLGPVVRAEGPCDAPLCVVGGAFVALAFGED